MVPALATTVVLSTLLMAWGAGPEIGRITDASGATFSVQSLRVSVDSSSGLLRTLAPGANSDRGLTGRDLRLTDPPAVPVRLDSGAILFVSLKVLAEWTLAGDRITAKLSGGATVTGRPLPECSFVMQTDLGAATVKAEKATAVTLDGAAAAKAWSETFAMPGPDCSERYADGKTEMLCTDGVVTLADGSEVRLANPWLIMNVRGQRSNFTIPATYYQFSGLETSELLRVRVGDAESEVELRLAKLSRLEIDSSSDLKKDEIKVNAVSSAGTHVQGTVVCTGDPKSTDQSARDARIPVALFGKSEQGFYVIPMTLVKSLSLTPKPAPKPLAPPRQPKTATSPKPKP